MPGIDRSRIVGKTEEELNEFSCGICQDVFNEPMVTPCRHTFCKECIDQWLTRHKTCPNDRKPLTKQRLTEAPRFVLNLIARMQIKCRLSDRGCPSVHSVDHDSTHMTVCQFVDCRRCGLNDPGPSHDCVIHLLQKNLNLTEDINQLRTENANLKTSEMAVKEENKSLRTELDLKRVELKTLNEKRTLKDAICQAKGKMLAIFTLKAIDRVEAEKYADVILECIEKFDPNSMTKQQLLDDSLERINDMDRRDKWSAILYLRSAIDYNIWTVKSIWLRCNELEVHLFTTT